MSAQMNKDELLAIGALLSLARPSLTLQDASIPRAVRMLNDWNGAGRVAGGIGYSSARAHLRRKMQRARV